MTMIKKKGKIKERIMTLMIETSYIQKNIYRMIFIVLFQIEP